VSSSFDVGDYVCVTNEKSPNNKGIIDQVRGSGWYSVQIKEANNEVIMKKARASQLTLISTNTKNSTDIVSDDNEISSTVTLPESAESNSPALDIVDEEEEISLPSPTIIDLDSDQLQNSEDAFCLSQVKHHLSFKKWVLFTDLHCSRSTLSTCLKVLDFVHQKAVEHNAGILFLGDFWHFRGTLRVDVLNAVLDKLAGWKQPLVMIPGNHDQVTLDGYSHALKPLQNSFRVDNNIPGPLIFSCPTLFGKALFIPHLRSNLVMEGLLKSNYSEAATAIFCHADVTGASMNDRIVSQGGLAPRFFPTGIPIYSGHFHKPHTVSTVKGVSIQYIGSPYEVSLSEAHQDKQLLVLDSSQGWKCIARHNIDLGRKHFRGKSLSDLMSLESQTQAGDRVVLSIPSEDLHNTLRQDRSDMNDGTRLGGTNKLDALTAELREKGVSVEIREVKTIADRPIKHGNAEDTKLLEELLPETIFTTYLTEQINRGLVANTNGNDFLAEGMELLKEIEAFKHAPEKNSKVKIQFTSLSLEGFGPFKKRLEYPLSNRGLILLRGVNKDGGSDSNGMSNGTGKSSLAMATLWALTGRVDSHVVNDGKVLDVITDGCKVTNVSVDGFLNNEYFRVVRKKTARKTSLEFYLGEQDMTTQSVTDTQEVINESLGVDFNILARTAFHGQHNINGLLEATDVKFKDELAYIVPLELWQQAASRSRTKSRELSKDEAKLKGMIALREEDLQELRIRRDHSREKVEKRRSIYKEKELLVEKEPKIDSDAIDISSIQTQLRDLEEKLSNLNRELEQQKQDRIKEEHNIKIDVEHQTQLVAELTASLASAQRKVDQSLFRVEAADAVCKNLKTKWNVSFSSEKPRKFEFDRCPTCLQPLSGNGMGHSHNALQEILDKEIDDALIETLKANEEKEEVARLRTEAAFVLKTTEAQLKEMSDHLKNTAEKWNIKMSETELLIQYVSENQRNHSSRLSESISILNQDARTEAIKQGLKSEKELLKAAEGYFKRSEDDVMKAKESLADMQSKAEHQRTSSATLSRLSEVFGAKGIQTFVLQYTIDALEAISQEYLDELSDGSLRLSLNLDDSDRVLRRASVRLPCGNYTERSLSSLSGGQWRRCQLALALGFSDLIGRRGRLQSSLMVLDEPFTHLDRSGRDHVGFLLRKLVKGGGHIGKTGSAGAHANTIIIVLQDLAAEELDETFDHVDEVIKENGFSSVKFGKIR